MKRPILAAAVLALSIAGHAGAAPPMHVEYSVDRTAYLARTSARCGFPVYRHESGIARMTLFQSPRGPAIREIDTQPGYKVEFYSPVSQGGTGGGFTVPEGNFIHTTYPEGVYVGAPATVEFVGLVNMSTLGNPEAGRYVMPGDVLFVDENGIPFTESFFWLAEMRGHLDITPRTSFCEAFLP